ncbi:hypothetical protein [Sphaerisporangium corydalis]|uniref:Uncharacterized protein n=1 Tax=Sphaerisporangium corydalis TaxID=1441875 RepID=A0ABV9E9J8_9ACTN|nr:hypothetical protein [Sphaerisporangium corydalis]
MNLDRISESTATLIAAIMAVIVAVAIPVAGWLWSGFARRSARRAELADLSDRLIIAVARFGSALDVHHQLWVSGAAKAKVGVLALAELAEGWARYHEVWGGLGGASRAVMGWDFAGNAALVGSLAEPTAQIAATTLLLDRCGDERLATAGRTLADAALSMRDHGDKEALTVAMEVFAAERWRVAKRAPWWKRLASWPRRGARRPARVKAAT